MSQRPTFLVPVDLSDCTDDVVRKAAELAKVNDARIVLLHAAQLPAGVPTQAPIRPEGAADASAASAVLLQEARDALDEHVRALRNGGFEAAARVEVGPEVDTILEVAGTLSPELIVMATRGRQGVSRLLLGNAADRVSREAPCPVVTVQTQRRPTCGAKSCDWCDSHVKPATRQVAAEADG